MISQVSSQLALDLPTTPQYGWENFFPSPSNEEGVSWIRQWPLWPHPCLVLYGPRGCGKTHLAHIWQEKSEAHFLSLEILEQFKRGEISVSKNSAWIWDDLTLTSHEEDLLHLYNRIHEAEGFLLILAETPPARWPVGLPDLRSRLNTIPAIQVSEPDDDLLRAVLLKQFSDLQIKVPENVLTYLVRHMGRSFSVARSLSHRINQASLKEQRNVTLPLVKKVLEGM